MLLHFKVASPIFLEETSIAILWKVKRQSGEHAVLKLYKQNDMRNERPGFGFLSDLNGNGAAILYEVADNSALLEWLEGPSLGDLSRNGEDQKANLELVKVANLLHQNPIQLSQEPPTLHNWFTDLFTVQLHKECDASLKHDIQKCQTVARHLLDTSDNQCVLHGDLHHDNIRLGSRGYCAFDAKGVTGERCYELANAFRNPRGAPDLVCDPNRILGLAAQWSQAFQVDHQRLLEWAAAKYALSIVWRNPVLRDDSEADLLNLLCKLTAYKDQAI